MFAISGLGKKICKNLPPANPDNSDFILILSFITILESICITTSINLPSGATLICVILPQGTP